MARKVFISFLGTGIYNVCHYGRGSYQSESMRFIQVATLEYLEHIGEWDKASASNRVIVLTTQDSEAKNWVDGVWTDKEDTGKPLPGLESELKRTRFDHQTSKINVPDGNNEKEILKIFETVFNLLKEGDEVYFDLTHGFRYLPMLVLVLGNYAKFLKGIKVRSITYGNWEGRNKETNVAQIVDLTQLSTLQDWTSAAASFINSGNADQLNELGKAEIRRRFIAGNGTKTEETLRNAIKTLACITSEMQTCRGLAQVSSQKILSLKNKLIELDGIDLPQLKPIFNKVSDQFAEFKEENSIINGLLSAKWCIEHNLFQQAITIMREFIVSYFYEYFYDEFKDEFDKIATFEDKRAPIEKALTLSTSKDSNNQDKWYGCVINGIDTKPIVSAIIQKFNYDMTFLEIYKHLVGLRNDINHGGMKNNPRTYKKVVSEAKEIYHEIYSALYGNVQH